jgi:hypothetical protein
MARNQNNSHSHTSESVARCAQRSGRIMIKRMNIRKYMRTIEKQNFLSDEDYKNLSKQITKIASGFRIENHAEALAKLCEICGVSFQIVYRLMYNYTMNSGLKNATHKRLRAKLAKRHGPYIMDIIT